MGARVKSGAGAAAAAPDERRPFNTDRADAVLPTLAVVLGLEDKP
jgi:hypothetical protein